MESDPNAYFVRGTAVHETIANQAITTSEEGKTFFFNMFSRMVLETEPEFPFRTSFSSMVKESYVMLDNYYNKINLEFPVPIPNHVEMFFKLDINGIEYSGVIDQIRGECIFDWKTTVKPLDPVTQNADYQFTLYGLAYKKLFGDYPKKIYYGHLYSGKVLEMPRTERDYKYLQDVSDQIIFSIENKIYPRNYNKFGCSYCPYKGQCFDENNKVKYQEAT